MIVNNRSADKYADFETPEPYDAKVSCTVLRGLRYPILKENDEPNKKNYEKI